MMNISKMSQTEIDKVKIELHTTKNMVLQLLKESQEYRNSEKALTEEFYKRYYGVSTIHDLLNPGVPNIRTVVRCRATIQNTYGLYQADPEVLEARDYRKVAHKQFVKGQ